MTDYLRRKAVPNQLKYDLNVDRGDTVRHSLPEFPSKSKCYVSVMFNSHNSEYWNIGRKICCKCTYRCLTVVIQRFCRYTYKPSYQ